MTKILKLNEAQEFVNRGVLEHNVEIGITNFNFFLFLDIFYILLYFFLFLIIANYLASFQYFFAF